jgi:outer membrane protein assembly factor BamB
MKGKAVVSFVLVVLFLVSVFPISTFSGAADSHGNSGFSVAQSTVDWWPMFHHDLNHTGNSTSVVHEYIESLWNYTTGGGVRCSPAVVDGKVFVGSEDGYLYALNATTREPINSAWIGAVSYSSPAVAGGRVFVGSINGSIYALDEITLGIIWNYPTNGSVESSPTVAYNKVFVGSSDNQTYALNVTDGSKRWNYTTKGPVRSSPAVSGGVVFFGSDDGYVYAIDATNGMEKWRFPTADLVWSSPAVVDGRVFVGVGDGRVYALNATTGKYLWHFETAREYAVVSSPAVAYGMVFVGSNDTRVYALNATDGRQLWNFKTGGPVVSSPAIAIDKVFVGSCDNMIYALNVTDGSLIWNFATGGPVVSSPAIFEGKVYVGSLDKNVYAFQANKPPQASFDFYPTSPIVTQMVTFNASASFDRDGSIISYTWSFGDGAVTETNQNATTHPYNGAGMYNVTLTLKDNFKPVGINATWQLITVREAWPMFRHDPTHVGNSTSPAPVSNGTLWKQTIGPVSYSSPAVINATVFIGSTNGTFYALNATDGNVIWSKTLGYAIQSSPAVADNMVFIALENGTISAWDVDGNFVWTNHTNGRIYSSPTVSGNRVFIACEDSNLYAFNKTNGNQLWLPCRLDGAVDSSPAVASGRVFVGTWNGTVYAIDETNGTVLESYAIGAQIHIISSPAVAYGKVFIGAGNGSIYALNMDCEFQWQKPIGGIIDSSPAIGSVDSSPAVFVGSNNGNIYAFDVTNGKELWPHRTIGSVGWSSPAVAEGKVFVGSTNGKIYALYEESGDIVWSYQTNASVDSSPAVLNDTLYVGSKDGNIYAFRSQVHDIGLTSVSVSPSLPVPQGIHMNITVTVRNEGTFNETNINVTTYYSNSTFYTAGNITIPSLARGTKITKLIQWDTTNVALGDYNISAVADTVPGETDTVDNNLTDGLVIIRPAGLRNIKVWDVVPFKTVVGQNYNVSINVTIENQGAFSEPSNVTFYANETIIGTLENKILTSGDFTTLTFTWNTTGFAKGNYTISAYAWPIPGEIDTADNTYIFDGVVTIAIVGDVNADGIVDIQDIYLIALAYGAVRTNSEYWHPIPCETCPHSPNLDINCDGIIDISDIYTASLHYGETDP